MKLTLEQVKRFAVPEHMTEERWSHLIQMNASFLFPKAVRDVLLRQIIENLRKVKR